MHPYSLLRAAFSKLLDKLLRGTAWTLLVLICIGLLSFGLLAVSFGLDDGCSNDVDFVVSRTSSVGRAYQSP